MTIMKTGAFLETDETFIYGYSDSSGQLLISNGYELILTSVTTGPFLSAGHQSSGTPDPDALGEIIIRDPGSLLEVISAGSSTGGASVSIASGTDTRGLMQVLDGGEFRMTDPTGSDGSGGTGGGESAWIGRFAGAEGTLEIRAADFYLSGTGASMSIGRDGGTGNVTVAEEAGFVMQTTSTGEDDFTHLRIGLSDGIGSMEVAESFALIQAGLNAVGMVDVGSQRATGHLTISGSTSAPFREGVFVVGNAHSPFVEMQIGREGGTGVLVMQGGTLALVNSGVEILREGGYQDFPDADASGGDAALIVGRDGGTGTLEANAGALVFINAQQRADVGIGVGGGDGSLVLDASVMTVESHEGEAGLMIGEWFDGGAATGTLELHNGASAVFEGDDGVFANIGRRLGNEGNIVITSGSRLELRAPDSRQGNLRVGRDEGTGTLQVTGEDSLVQLSGDLSIGRDGGSGLASVADGAEILNEHQFFAATRIGYGTAALGTATLDDSSLSTQSLSGYARLVVGGNRGEGVLQGAAAALHVRGNLGVDVAIGEGVGADGHMRLTSNSIATLISDEGGVNLDVGRSAGTGLVEVIASELNIAAPMGEDSESYAFVLVGTQGGTGTLVFDAAQASIEAHSAGIHIGTRWTGTVANEGEGSMILRNDSEVFVRAGQDITTFWVGGGAGSNGAAQILSGSVLDFAGNGLVQIGFASPDMTGGGTGLVTVDGEGSLLTGVYGLDLGRGGSDGVLHVSNAGHAHFGGLTADRNVNLDIGWDADSIGEIVVTDALVSVQAGSAENEQFEFKGVTANFGRHGGTGLATITGARQADENASHGFVLFGHAESDYVDITLGQGSGSEGHAIVRGALFGARNDGTTFGPEGEVNLSGVGGYAALRIGLDGGQGSLEIGERSELFVISGRASEAAVIVVGSGAGGEGALHVSGETEVDIMARQYDAWMLVGSEGGASGTVTITESSVHIEAARNGGVRLGTSWFDTPDKVGTAQLTLEQGSDLTISAQGSGSNFFVGGGAGSEAQAIIRDSEVTLEGQAHRLVIVGGTPAFVPGTGGEGKLTLQGEAAGLYGARDVLVGTNGGNGLLELREGAQLILEDAGGGRNGEVVLGLGIGRVREGEPEVSATGALSAEGPGTHLGIEAAEVARLIIGTGGGEASAQISDGASVRIAAQIGTIEIGVDGGVGRLDVTGDGTVVNVDSADGRIHIGRVLNAQANAEGAGRGILNIGTDSEVLVNTKIEVGDTSGATAVLAMSGGRLTTPLVELHAGAGYLNNMLLGHGEIVGITGQPSLVMAGSSFFVGDEVAADGAQITSTGLMTVTGSVIKQDSNIHFDIGDQNGGFDQVAVTGEFVMDGGRLHVSLLDGAQDLLAGNGVRLLSASEGIFLNDVAFLIDALPDGTEITTEFRLGQTELWAVLEGGPVSIVPLPLAWQNWLDWIGGGGGAPPPAPEVARADTIADPHLVTLDGLAYDFHAVGEYILTRAEDGSFEVQARMAPVGENASENVAAAVRLEGGAVMVDVNTPDSVLVNGSVVALDSGESVMVGGDLVYRTGNTFHMVHRHGDPDGDTLSAVSATLVDGRLDISVFLNPVLAGQVNGLLGNFDGDPDTDLALPDGQLVSRPLVFGDDPGAGVLGLYGAFRDAWRITDAQDSLFTYGVDEGPDSFYLPDYPSSMITLDAFDPAEIESATEILLAAGLEEDSVAFNNALFDLLATGNPAYVDAAVTFQIQQAARPEAAPEIIAPEVTGGALEGLLSAGGAVRDVSGAAMEGVRVTFTPQGQSVAHIRNSRGDGEFGFDLLPNPNGGFVEASRTYDAAVDGRPSALDALNVLRLAVGIQPSFGPAPGEAFIAADMNRDGKITALDALEVLRAAVGVPSANTPGWVFIDADADLSGLNRHNAEAPVGVSLGAIEESMGSISLTGILLGNMQEFA